MARSNIDIAVNVHDAASGKLRGASKEVDNFGRSVKKASVDVTQFNRVMFSTTAYIGLFTSGFQKFATFLNEGANLDRLSNQFERVIGPRGEFFQSIKGFTTTAIDRFEAMRAGIELKSLGIIRNTGQIAEVIARAGTAAKLAGKDSGLGVQAFTKFLTSGNVQNLEFLNLIAKTNPALQAQMAILQKAGGIMGGVISTQARLALGYRLLREATRGAMKGQRDLADIMLDLRQSFAFMRSTVGRFLGAALAPLLEKVVDLVDKFTDFLDNVRKNEKNILFLTKSIIVATAAVAGLAAAFGTLRLATIALSSLGVGLPALLGVVTTLSLAFLGVTHSVDGFMEKLKLFAAFFRGTFQLVHSFLSDPENFAKGIGKMDESIAKLLDKHGILGLATNLARVSAIIIRFVDDAGTKMINWFKKIDEIVGKFVGTLFKLLGMDSGPWSRNWIESGNRIRDALTTAAAAILPLMAAFRLLKFGGGLIGGITGMAGRLFGGGGSGGPKGTATDPIFTVDMKSGMLGLGKGAKQTGENILAMFGFLGADLFKVRWLEILSVLKNAGSFLRVGISGISNLIGTIARVWAPLVVIGAAVYGAFKGIFETSEEWKKFFSGIFNLAKAVVGKVIDVILSFEPLKQIVDLVAEGFGMLADAIVSLLKMIAEGWEKIAGWIGIGAGKLGETFQGWADQLAGKKKEQPKKVAGTQIPALETASTLEAVGQTGQQTSTVNPAMPEAEEEKQQKIVDFLSSVDAKNQAAAKDAFFQAISKSGAGGASITPEEWVSIFAAGMDRSQNIKKVADKQEKSAPATSGPRR